MSTRPEIVFRVGEMSDVRAISSTFTRSFWDDPVMRWLFPDDGLFAGGTVMRDFFRRMIAHGSTLVTSDVVSFAMWVPPGRPEVDLEPTVTEALTDDLIAKFVALRGALDAHTPAEPHWYLQMVGTHPDWQRRGIGSALITEGLGWAARDGVGAYLETETAENVAYYRHLGFEVRTEWDVGAGGPHMWGMWHPAP